MKKLNRIFFSLTITWMIIIFIFSAQSGENSADMSGGITEFIISILYADFDSYNPSKQVEIIDTVHFFIRKCAHFAEYAILGLLSVLTILTHIYSDTVNKIYRWKKTSFKAGLMALAFSALYAVSDEIHQNFVSDRMPSIIDVLIDSSGALAGIIFTCIMFYIFYIRKELQKKRA